MEFIKASSLKSRVVLPCPFCGEKEEIYLWEYDTPCGKRWRIACVKCMAQIDRGTDQQYHELIDLWNKRFKDG